MRRSGARRRHPDTENRRFLNRRSIRSGCDPSRGHDIAVEREPCDGQVPVASDGPCFDGRRLCWGSYSHTHHDLGSDRTRTGLTAGSNIVDVRGQGGGWGGVGTLTRVRVPPLKNGPHGEVLSLNPVPRRQHVDRRDGVAAAAVALVHNRRQPIFAVLRYYDLGSDRTRIGLTAGSKIVDFRCLIFGPGDARRTNRVDFKSGLQIRTLPEKSRKVPRRPRYGWSVR